MSWSIAQVARMSGVTARTLRHYDDIGLLKPDHVGANGYRYYEEAQLLRLQQILVLRELGLGLSEIAEAIDSEPDTIVALRRQYGRLLVERDRLSRVAETVRRTIAELEGKPQMSVHINRPENLFEGFEESQYEDEARERWPEEFEQAQAKRATMTEEDLERWQREATAAMIRMAEFMAAGTPVDDPAVQDEVHQHYQGICIWWTPNRSAYKCVGQMYVDDERFKANYLKIAEGLAEYQAAAMAAYADARLTD
ncbi:transcriptional regulator, MerR family [Catenulispora acidiphila DSM 44928]|uniref:Transcriptional regulator, MerR family n=1 Tax=Catenulispora acidiphila (strain DSM 44928 / JCM 14897 / NBRC 102108 / NRRL B-24433 / ID139908) TaxID=479433 RepID=C7QH81_CATAD|nr:MerR family transcriptional regulator [Catenulispora acidiphila]ACU69020.1 transcriptional regulator, MerR family [Catenulispora acidiphila DSM 44928]